MTCAQSDLSLPVNRVPVDWVTVEKMGSHCTYPFFRRESSPHLAVSTHMAEPFNH